MGRMDADDSHELWKQIAGQSGGEGGHNGPPSVPQRPRACHHEITLSHMNAL